VVTENRYLLLKVILLGLVAVLLQFSFIPLIKIGVWRPDLILLFTLYVGYRFGAIPGTLTGFFLGVIQDSIGPNPVGISALANCIVGFLAGQIVPLKLSYNARILMSIMLILLHGAIYFLIYQFKTEATYFYLIFTRVFPNTVYTFLIGLFLSVFFRSQLEKV
jgi:rod shape-determining protein MreD